MKSDPVLTIDQLVIHLNRQEVLVDGLPIVLAAAEYRLLCLLAQHPGVVFTRQQIIQAVRGDDYPATDRSVDTQLVTLRKKLLSAASLIETIRGVGYRLRP
jgi:two-component system, OmpR family, alkaline phosphatase synthesis response regulator PhoP